MGAIDFDWQPVLEGPRLRLQPVAAEDWVALFDAAADPAIWAQHPSPDRYLEPVFRQYFDDALRCGGALVVVDRDTGRIIGSSRYHGLDTTRSEIEIGWTFLTRDRWGGSYNLEVKALMLDHAFRFVDTVVFWVGENNLRSRRAVERLGAEQRPGRVSRGQTTGDTYHVVYALSRDRWHKRASAS